MIMFYGLDNENKIYSKVLCGFILIWQLTSALNNMRCNWCHKLKVDQRVSSLYMANYFTHLTYVSDLLFAVLFKSFFLSLYLLSAYSTKCNQHKIISSNRWVWRWSHSSQDAIESFAVLVSLLIVLAYSVSERDRGSITSNI